MPYPVPLQVHVIWHPDSEAICFPLAEKLYLALNRDPSQPFLSSIGIPVFFRCVGSDPASPRGLPAPIAVPAPQYDLRVVLTTSELLLDKGWWTYVTDNLAEVAGQRSRSTVLMFGKLPPKVATLATPMDLGDPGAGELILLQVLLQACRLIAQRPLQAPSPAGGRNLGAAPLKLFLSHTKRNALGRQIAVAVKTSLDGMTVDRFFDEVSIQPGDDIGSTLEADISDSALVAIRTDGYMASPWCRKEVALAKRERRPMVVLDALVDKEARSSPFLSNLSSARLDVDCFKEIDPGTPDDRKQEHKRRCEVQLARITNFLGLEVLRFLHAERQLDLLQQHGMVERTAILLPRQPELRDVAVLLADKVPSRTFVHPDPVLSAEEAEQYTAYQADFKTPTSVYAKRLSGLALGISVSLGDPAEERALGLSSLLHLQDATRIIARQALAAGAVLVYGGALEMQPGKPGQLTEALFEMVGAYNRGGYISAVPLINYVAWPYDEEVDNDWLASRLEMLTVIRWPRPGDLSDPDPQPGAGKFKRLAATPLGGYALARSLSAMREELVTQTKARVILGGRPTKFSGIMPGIVEEALLTVRARAPLYVMGGFGGAARLVAKAIRGERPKGLTREFQEAESPSYADVMKTYRREMATRPELTLPEISYEAIVQEFADYGLAGISKSNGLTEDENREMFATGSIDSALFLLMKGLSSIA
jgi:SLOG cluster2/TIR domain